MIFKLSSLPKFFFTYICPTFYGKGGSAPPTNTTSTVNQNTIPAELMPYALGNLQAAKGQLFKTDASGQITGYQPYKPYSADPNKSVAGFSALQKQAQQGAAGLQMPGQYGTATGMATGAGQGALGAGEAYNQAATDPGAMSQWMSPYMNNVVDYQTQQANRQYDISGAQQMGSASRAGAFGGSRDAIMAAENERNRNQGITGIQATGAQNAWQDARQAQQFGANLGMQGYNTALQGAQTLGTLGDQQLAAQTGILNTQNQYGAQQQERQQALMNQRIKNWENQQNQPYRAMDVMSGLIRGTPIAQSSTSTNVANPSYAQQFGGMLGTAGSLYGAYKGKANGGIVQAYANGGSVEQGIESKLRDMTPEQLQAYIPTITSQEELDIAKQILAEETATGYAEGGIPRYNGKDGSFVGDMRLPESAAYEQRNAKIQEEANRQSEIDKKKMEIAREKAILEAKEKEKYAHLSYEERNAKIQKEANVKEDSLSGGLKSIKDWATTPIISTSAKDKDTTPTGISAVQTEEKQPEAIQGDKTETLPVASTANLPGSIVEGTPNKINLANSSEATGIKGAAQEGQVYPQEIGKAYDQQGYNAPVQSSAYQPSEEVAQTAAPQPPADDGLGAYRATAAKTPLQIMQERQAEMEKAGIKSSDQVSTEQRKEIMDEKANAKDESKRQMYLRMADFFSNWGRTPGLPLVAGLKAMKETLPGVMSDSKEDHAVMHTINKSLRDLEHATELEKAGKYNEAYAIKEQASAAILKHKEHVIDLGARREQLNIEQAGAKERAQISAGASMYGASERANGLTPSEHAYKKTNVEIDNLQKQLTADQNALKDHDEYSEEYATIKKDILNNRNKLRTLLNPSSQNTSTQKTVIPVNWSPERKEEFNNWFAKGKK